MLMTPNQTKTTVLETTDRYDRVRTQCNDQNYVRDYYMNQVSICRAIAAVAYLLDIMMDMNIAAIDAVKDQVNLTPEQLANFEKIKYYNSKLSTLTLETNKWEMDWVYGEVKVEQNKLGYQFFQKRTELNLGDPLPE